VKVDVGQNGFIGEKDFFDSNILYLILDLSKKKYSTINLSRRYASGRINYWGKKIVRNTKPPYKVIISYGKKQQITEFKTMEEFFRRAKYLGFSVNYIINNYNQIEVELPEEYQNCIFFNEIELKEGLKARGIPENIKLFDPQYFYKKFLNEGQCHWFPKAEKLEIKSNLKSSK
jgi:hypothetical protein